MDAFSYLSVLLSVILGLAVQQVLMGYRALALHRGRIRFYWPSIAWSLVILMFAAQHWWASFGLAGRASWSFADFAAILTETGFIYMMAALVFPDVPADGTLDLKDHYFRERLPFFAVGSGAVSWSIVRELILERDLPDPANLAFHLLFLAMALIAMRSRSERLHALFAGAMLALFVVYVTLLFARLGG